MPYDLASALTYLIDDAADDAATSIADTPISVIREARFSELLSLR